MQVLDQSNDGSGHELPDLARRSSRSRLVIFAIGLCLSVAWLLVAGRYFALEVGWESLIWLLPHEKAVILGGVTLPVLVIWTTTIFLANSISDRALFAILQRSLDRLDRQGKETAKRVDALGERLGGLDWGHDQSRSDTGLDRALLTDEAASGDGDRSASLRSREKREISRKELDSILADHQRWLETDGGEGVRADFAGTRLIGVNLENAVLRHASFRSANLARASLEGTDLREANLQDAQLMGTRLCGSNLERARLENATLVRANLQNCRLNNARMASANLQSAELNGAYLVETDLSGCTLLKADLSGATLHRAILAGADLQKSVLFQADFRAATMIDADLKGADLFHARLDEADLAGCDLHGAKKLSPDQLRSARLDSGTRLPKNVKVPHVVGYPTPVLEPSL